MKSKAIFVWFLLGFLLIGFALPNGQAPSIVIIDGDMSDWENIPSLVNDSGSDVPGMNLIGAQVSNDSDFLYIRMTYANGYEFPLLWGNVTLRNQADDVFVLMAFVSTDGSQEDTWVFPGISLETSLNSQTASFDDYSTYPQYAKMASDNVSIEFKIPFSDIDSGNSSNLSELDFVFWHFDAFQAEFQLNQASIEDRAPDTGFVTYFTNPVVQSSTSDSPSSSSTSSTSSSTPTTSSTSITSVISSTDTNEGFLEINMFILSTSLILIIMISRKNRKSLVK